MFGNEKESNVSERDTMKQGGPRYAGPEPAKEAPVAESLAKRFEGRPVEEFITCVRQALNLIRDRVSKEYEAAVDEHDKATKARIYAEEQLVKLETFAQNP